MPESPFLSSYLWIWAIKAFSQSYPTQTLKFVFLMRYVYFNWLFLESSAWAHIVSPIYGLCAGKGAASLSFQGDAELSTD